MKRSLLGVLAAATTAALTASVFTVSAAAQSDQQPTHAELVQHWAEAALDTQLKGMKTSLRLTADQEKDWTPFESTVQDVAKLRLLLVEPRARGLGVGSRLVEECIRFAGHAGYRKITLWTQSILTPARATYQRSGFTKVADAAHCSFGVDLIGETWELGL